MMKSRLFFCVVFFFIFSTFSTVTAGTFLDESLPQNVPVGKTMGIELTYSAPAVQKCFLTTYRKDGKILQYFQPETPECSVEDGKVECSDGQLYLDNSGRLRFQFKLLPSTYQPNSEYRVVVDCGEDTYNSTFTTAPAEATQSSINLMVFFRRNSEYFAPLLILSVPILLLLYRVLDFLFGLLRL